MIVIELFEILNGLALLQRITSIAWLNKDAHSQYQDFREEIDTLEQNLKALHDVVCEVQSVPEAQHHLSTRQSSPATECLTRVLTGFQDTLDECWILLQKRRAYGESRGPVNNLQWELFVKDDLAILRDRLAVHNIKLSMALSCLNLTHFQRLRNIILSATEYLGRQIHSQLPKTESLANDRYLLPEPQSAISQTSGVSLVPAAVESALTVIMETRHGSLRNIPLASGIDEAVFYLDQATKPGADHTHLVASILRASWLLEATEHGDECQAAVNHPSFVEFEAQLCQFGMTLPLFLRRLEERIRRVYQDIVMRQHVLPGVEELGDIIKREKNLWLERRRRDSPRDILNPRQGNRVMECQLYCVNQEVQKQFEVYQNGQESLTLITGTSSCSDKMIYKTDLHHLHFGPHPDTDHSETSYPVTIKQNRASKAESADHIRFLQTQDLFRFQGLVTGYQVVDNLPDSRVTCQFSRGEKKWVLWKGIQWTERGRIQLWTSNSRPDPVHGLPSCGSVLKPDFDIEKRDSNISTPTRSSSASELPSQRYIQLHGGNFGAILEAPESPRLVIFLLNILLVIKINDDIKLKPDRCGCEVDEAMKESDCREVVIKSTSRYIGAKSATTVDPAAGYNIASAGRYQRGSLTKVEKLTLVTIGFKSVAERVRFTKHFEELKELHRVNRRSGRHSVG